MPSGDQVFVSRSDAIATQCQDLLGQLMKQKHAKHAIVAVESGDGSFRWIGTAGEANPDGTPMRAETPFFVASVTKLYIAVVIMRLYERGLIGLDSPISTYLPQSLISGLHRMGGVDHTDAITIRHLLSHTSGLPDWLEDRPKGGQGLLEQVLRDGDRALDMAEITGHVRDQLTPHFPPQPLGYKPRKVRYSDTNFQLLIAITESVTGQPLHQVFEQEILRPLGLRHTHHLGRSPQGSTAPATIWADSQPLELPLVIKSSGDLYSTADESLAFLRALVRGKLFEDPETLGLMQQHWNRFGFPLDAAALRSPNWPIEYGLGMMRFRLPRLLTPLWRMPAVIGHSGATGSWLFHCPELDLFLCGTVDQISAGAVPYRVIPKLIRIFQDSR